MSKYRYNLGATFMAHVADGYFEFTVVSRGVLDDGTHVYKGEAEDQYYGHMEQFVSEQDLDYKKGFLTR
jgi:hypothetical protein